ncbi:hypothetical protein AAVH_10755 [Aphelenchoides avenae]|nr:hypothetical protein AAVH_10755 [Aphelenchus avenae]
MSQDGRLPRMLLLSDSATVTSSTTSTGSVLDRIKQFLPEIASANERLVMDGNAAEATDCGITVEKVGALDSDDSDDDSSASEEDVAGEEREAEEEDDSDEEHGSPAENPGSSTISFDICVFDDGGAAEDSDNDGEEEQCADGKAGGTKSDVPTAFQAADRSAAETSVNRTDGKKRKLIEEV